jgi:hypothetical protein
MYLYDEHFFMTIFAELLSLQNQDSELCSIFNSHTTKYFICVFFYQMCVLASCSYPTWLQERCSRMVTFLHGEILS